MKIIKFLIVSCFGLALVVPRQAVAGPKKQMTSKAQKKKPAAQSKKQPTVEETSKWIQSSLREYGNFIDILYEEWRLVSWSNKNGNVTLIIQCTSFNTDNAGNHSVWNIDRYIIPINALTPDSVTVEDHSDEVSGLYFVRCSATAEKKVIKDEWQHRETGLGVNVPITLKTGTTQYDNFHVEVLTKERADRLCVAFKHLITLSGGKTSSKKSNEPF